VRRLLLPLLLVAAGLLLAGCGGDSSSETTSVKVYFLRDGKVWPVGREIEKPKGLLNPVLHEALVAGPTAEEKALGLESEVTADDGSPSRSALAQLVYTYTQSDPTSATVIDDKEYERSDFEDQTPAILVESPLPFAEVRSPLSANGTANTFEATFNYEVYDADGNMVDENFVTATSGTGTRGTFDFTTGDFDSISKLVVFEPSAEDGSKTKLVEIPLTSS
jgi:immunoglobulin-like protein involved in spore germination